jgi:3-oxo-5-alpha-steroid 4-dehydrogenase 3 / polyprenol reductase
VVPKRIFWHFYAFGLVCIVLKEFVFPTPQTSLVTLLLAVQCLRRLCECFWVMPGGRDSKMHLIHYLIGITYYPVLLLSFSSGNFASYSPKTDWTTWYFILLFISSSLVQFYCHWILELGNIWFFAKLNLFDNSKLNFYDNSKLNFYDNSKSNSYDSSFNFSKT